MAGNEYKEARLTMIHEFGTSLHKDREIRWSQRGSEMKHDAAMGNFRKLFHLPAAGRTALGVSETIYEAVS